MCMNSFLGFGSQYVDRHHARSGQRAYLHIIRTRKAQVSDYRDLFFCLFCFVFNHRHGSEQLIFALKAVALTESSLAGSQELVAQCSRGHCRSLFQT